jgi:5-methylcytosine-specific restriction endonuclease McrA
MKSKRTKATDIDSKTRKMIHERDRKCISCGSHHNLTIAHVFVNRSHGGLGISENLCLLCIDCHMKMDHGKQNVSNTVKYATKSYMNTLYPNINIENLKYRKGTL